MVPFPQLLVWLVSSTRLGGLFLFFVVLLASVSVVGVGAVMLVLRLVCCGYSLTVWWFLG